MLKTKKKKPLVERFDWRIAVAAICVIGALEAFALSKGIDGIILSLSLASITGIAGFKLKR